MKTYYYRLLQDHPALNSFLLSMNIEFFSTCLIRSLESIVREFRAYGEMLTPLSTYWPECSSTGGAFLDPSESNRVAETFLALVSQLEGVVWNGALEHTWSKAINTVMSYLCGPVNDPFIFSLARKISANE